MSYPHFLGASLYCPIKKFDLKSIDSKWGFLKSVIVDCEDATTASDLEEFFPHLIQQLKNISAEHRKNLVYLRVRDPKHLTQAKSSGLYSIVDGLVLPKFSFKNAEQYLMPLGRRIKFMPVLESEVFSEKDLLKTFRFLKSFKKQIIGVRVGANDIYSFLGMKRDISLPIYSNPIFLKVFSDIFIKARQLGLPVIGPVFNSFNLEHLPVLAKEVAFEKELGIFSKSSIHPLQSKFIHRLYQVSKEEQEVSNLVISSRSAVDSFKNQMMEKVILERWAIETKVRADQYGISI